MRVDAYRQPFGLTYFQGDPLAVPLNMPSNEIAKVVSQYIDGAIPPEGDPLVHD